MNYCVRISCVQYGNAYVSAKNPEDAKKKARELYNARRIDWFEEEITDMLVEDAEPEEVDRMERETMQIMKVIIDRSMEMELDSIDYRVALEELSDCTYLIEKGYSPEAVLKIHESTTCGELYDMLDKYLERMKENG